MSLDSELNHCKFFTLSALIVLFVESFLIFLGGLDLRGRLRLIT